MQRVRSVDEDRPYRPPMFTYLCKECGGQATSYHASLNVSRYATGVREAIDVRGNGLGTWRCHACNKPVKVSRHAA